MSDLIELTPLVGYGAVHFGMTADEVRSLLGEPDEVEEGIKYNDDDPSDLSTEYYYADLGLSLTFDKIYGYRLTDIMTEEGSRCQLSGGIKLGDTLEAVLRRAQELDYGPAEENNEDDLDDDERAEVEAENLTEIDYDEQQLFLWFKNGVLDTIQLGPDIDDDGEPLFWSHYKPVSRKPRRR